MPTQSMKKSPHATYRDILDAPPGMVAEIIGGNAPYASPTRDAARLCGVISGIRTCQARFSSAAAGPVAGGSLTNRNCIWAVRSWCPIWWGGGGRRCPSTLIRRVLHDRSRLGLRDAFSDNAQVRSLRESGHSMPAKMSDISGLSIRSRGNSRLSSLGTVIGC